MGRSQCTSTAEVRGDPGDVACIQIHIHTCPAHRCTVPPGGYDAKTLGVTPNTVAADPVDGVASPANSAAAAAAAEKAEPPFDDLSPPPRAPLPALPLPFALASG